MSMNVLELFGMVWTANVMIVIRKELPEWEGEVVLMRRKTRQQCSGAELQRGERVT